MKGATSGASQVQVEKNAEVVSVSIRTCIWKLWKSEAIDQGRINFVSKQEPLEQGRGRSAKRSKRR